MPVLVAATALLIDYVLTVAVSISAGVSAIVSAAASLDRYRVTLAVVCIALIAWDNLDLCSSPIGPMIFHQTAISTLRPFLTLTLTGWSSHGRN